MRAATLKYPAIMLQHSIWSGMDQRQHGELVISVHQMSRRGIKFTYQSTSDMAADSLTKGLGASRLPRIKEDLCLVEE